VVSLTNDEKTKEYMIREIEMIQDIINRMGLNSFAAKGWAVTLVVGILLFKGPAHQALIALIPVLAFWYLDAYFLWQERMYRQAYEWVLKNRLETEEHLFDMNAIRFETSVPSKIRTMFSITLVLLYGTIAIAIILYYLSLLFLS
jgi:hypothetical protein